MGTTAAAIAALLLLFSLRGKVTGPVLSWLSTFSAPAPKPDFSKNFTIDLVIQNGTFYPDKIYAEEGANLFINFTNKDAGVEHNFVLYREFEGHPSAIASQNFVLGPGTAVYRVRVPRFGPDGAYWFACSNHYVTEQGSFIVTWPSP